MKSWFFATIGGIAGNWRPHSVQWTCLWFCLAPQPGHRARSLPFPFLALGLLTAAATPARASLAAPGLSAEAKWSSPVSAFLTMRLAMRRPGLQSVQGLPSIIPALQPHLAASGVAVFSALAFIGLGTPSSRARRAMSLRAAFQLP